MPVLWNTLRIMTITCFVCSRIYVCIGNVCKILCVSGTISKVSCWFCKVSSCFYNLILQCEFLILQVTHIFYCLSRSRIQQPALAVMWTDHWTQCCSEKRINSSVRRSPSSANKRSLRAMISKNKTRNILMSRQAHRSRWSRNTSCILNQTHM